MRKNSNTLILTLLITVATSLVSCNRKTVFNRFEHTPQTGWEKNDTLIFRLHPINRPGEYEEEIGLRIADFYPFTAICLIVDRTIISKDKTQAPRTLSDTLTCRLFDANGIIEGKGVSLFQYSVPASGLPLTEGDSVEVRIRHNMKREILHGITDIGYKLSARHLTVSVNTKEDEQ